MEEDALERTAVSGKRGSLCNVPKTGVEVGRKEEEEEEKRSNQNDKNYKEAYLIFFLSEIRLHPEEWKRECR